MDGILAAGNFAEEAPVVYHGPHEYAVPVIERDHAMQNFPKKITRG